MGRSLARGEGGGERGSMWEGRREVKGGCERAYEALAHVGVRQGGELWSAGRRVGLLLVE